MYSWTEQTETKTPVMNWTAVDSSRDGRHLVAVGGGQAYGVWVSHDGGDTWSQCKNMPNTVFAWAAACISDDGQKIVALHTTTGGGYRSTDGGATWVAMNLTNGAFKTISCSADGSMLVAAGDGIYGFVYTSSDSGQTWTKRNVVSTTYYPWRASCMSADGMIMYVATGVTSGTNYYAKSTNGGVTWMTVGGGGRSSNDRMYSLACSDDGQFMVGARWAYGITFSTDGGLNWSATSVPSVWPNRSIASVACSSDGQRIVAVSDGASGFVSTSEDFGATWKIESGPGTARYAAVSSSADGKSVAALKYQQAIWTAIEALPHQSWSAMYIGSTQIKSLYKGSTLVWQAP